VNAGHQHAPTGSCGGGHNQRQCYVQTVAKHDKKRRGKLAAVDERLARLMRFRSALARSAVTVDVLTWRDIRHQRAPRRFLGVLSRAHIPSVMAAEKAQVQLRRLGFCGADDSCDPWLLQLVSSKHPYVEWGVLFRPDREGQPRYATWKWVQHLACVNARTGRRMRLAAHLCGSRVPEVLSGDATFVKQLAKFGFGRVQVNATAINGVDTSNLSAAAEGLAAAMRAVPEVEWIVQLNDETQPLFDGLAVDPPANMSLLFDKSCGTGVSSGSLPPPHASIPSGYAGGMGPANIAEKLTELATVAPGRGVWVDMESSLRATVDGADVFSVAKCFECLQNAKGLFVAVDAAAAAAATGNTAAAAPSAASATPRGKAGKCPMGFSAATAADAPQQKGKCPVHVCNWSPHTALTVGVVVGAIAGVVLGKRFLK